MRISKLGLSSLFVVGLFSTQLQAKYKFIAQDRGQLSIIDEKGEVSSQMKLGGIHDIHQLNKNKFLTHQKTKVMEIDMSKKKIVWQFDCKKLYPKLKIEVHSFLPNDDGTVTVAVSGAGEIITINREGEVLSKFSMKLNRPHPHKDTRLIRSTPNGNILASHEGDGFVREYTKSGELVWEYQVPMFGKESKRGHGVDAFGNSVFSSVRLKNGNTVICTGNGHSVIEVNPEKKIVWSLHQNDLEGIQLAWVTTIEVLDNGNFLIGNCHAGEANPQLIEVSRDKKVVWQYKNFETFGNALSNSMVLNHSQAVTR